MEGYSHALSGAVAGAAAGEFVLHLPLVSTFGLAGLTAGMALLPDLDCTGGCAARSLGLLSKAVAFVIRSISGGHRHASHSLTGIAAFTILAYLACAFRSDVAGKAGLALLITLAVASALDALRLMRGHTADIVGIAVAAGVIWAGWWLALIPLATLLGCCTHVAGDACTDSGVRVLYPLSGWKLHLLPEPLAFTTGTRPETRFVDPVLTGLVVVLGGWAVDPGFIAAHIHALASSL